MLGHCTGVLVITGQPSGIIVTGCGGAAAAEPKPCASPNGQSKVGHRFGNRVGQNSGTRVGQLNLVGQASIKLGHCTTVASAASPNGQSRVGRGQNGGSVGQLNRVGQASIKLGHCTTVASAASPN